jgi:hypothetical protein
VDDPARHEQIADASQEAHRILHMLQHMVHGHHVE